MLKFFVLSAVLSAVVSTPWAFAEGEFKVCQDVKKGTKVIFVDAGEKQPLLALFRNDSGKVVDFVEADVCERKGALSEEIAANLSDLDTVVGACVSITNDAGDGQLAVLRQRGDSQFELEFKPIEVEKPNKAKGKIYPCS